MPNYWHIDGLAGSNKNGIYGRAFAAKMLEYDKDESISKCNLDFGKEAINLEEMAIDAVAETPTEETSGSLLGNLMREPLKRFAKDYCRYFGGD